MADFQVLSTVEIYYCLHYDYCLNLMILVYVKINCSSEFQNFEIVCVCVCVVKNFRLNVTM